MTPNIALLPALTEAGFEIHYIGSYDGIEKRLMEDYKVSYYGIATGKFRRYFALKNFTDPLRVIKGYGEARKILKQLRPDVVFSKGGFVSVPVVRAAHSLGIPCIIHESDMTPGLANKLCIPVAQKVCCNFPETLKMLPADKAVLTGSPIRAELRQGNRIAALDLCGFTANKPVVMVIGGSLGAASINKTVREALPSLLEDFQVIHICGKEKVDNLLLNVPGYKQPNVLIPLSARSSRGDQILNARSFESQGFSLVIDEDDLIDTLLIEKVHEIYFSRQIYMDAMGKSDQLGSIQTIMKLIEKAAAGSVS